MRRTDGSRGAMTDGLWLPMVTPLRSGQPDLPGVQRLASFYAAAGVDGLIILGTTGEGGLLSEPERLMVAAAALEAVQGAVPVMAGVGGVDTRSVCEQVRRLDRFDLAGYLVPPPYYLRVSDEGIAWHVGRVASQTARPLMLYNVPKRTGCTISPDLARRLAAHPQVVAIKECDPAGLRALSGQAPLAASLAAHPALPLAAPLAVFCGEDAAMLDHLLAGGAGVVPATAHIRPDLFVRLLQLVRTGREEAARALFRQLAPLIGLMFAEPNPAPVKAALALCGLARAEVRRPLTPATRALVARIEAAIALLPPQQASASATSMAQPA